MKQMTSAEIRQNFLDFFEEMGHKKVASSSLVPSNDPTLLFTNAGMVQFKDVFLGGDKRSYKRATTSQKSMRVSGKHSDIENVGPSLRHHTFFEMLGNFSFGDYFKRDAIIFAYDLLTKVYELPPERLVFTVYENDDEAFKIWTEDIGVSPKRVARMGPKTNFWQMADTGPCGPTSEIHWDKTPELGEGSIVPLLKDEDERFLEIWNLVFMQYNRTHDDPTHTGQFDVPLPAPGVDTGMGLERIVSIIQGVKANYETDLFMPIIRAVQALAGQTDEERIANIVPYRVIADHTRAAVFLIADGVNPGAKGRDSVCRLMIRRAVRFGTKLGFNAPFLAPIAQAVIDVMGSMYSDLVYKAERIKKIITQEEERFFRTLERGLIELDEMLAALPTGGTLAGDKAFYLKSTLGLPIQVTKDIAEERGYTLDMTGYESAEGQHSIISGGGQAMGHMESAESYKALLIQLQKDGQLPAEGVAYDPYNAQPVESRVIALLQNGQPVQSAIVGDKVEVVLNATPFYVESGGQVSDTGTISGPGWVIEVEDMKKAAPGLIVHVGEVVEGTPRSGDTATAAIDDTRRHDIIRNHTGTHLLHAALRHHLGTHVEQRGSLVAPDRLRFDFSHSDKVGADELARIQAEINESILHNYPVRTEIKSLDQAKSEGAMALFNEKYSDTVRTVIVDDGKTRYSYELCGGTHVGETAEIGAFVITGEGSTSAGVRRVEAVTGRSALAYIQEQMQQLQRIASALETTPDQAIAKLHSLQEDAQASKKQIGQLQSKLAKYRFDELIENLEMLNGNQALIAQIDGVPADTLREMADWFRSKVKEKGVVVLGGVMDDKPSVLVALTDDLVKGGLKAGDLIKPIAAVIGGGGGGRPNLAQAGGKDASQMPQALQKARELLSQ